jgi:hypothetical protein
VPNPNNKGWENGHEGERKSVLLKINRKPSSKHTAEKAMPTPVIMG